MFRDKVFNQIIMHLVAVRHLRAFIISAVFYKNSDALSDLTAEKQVLATNYSCFKTNNVGTARVSRKCFLAGQDAVPIIYVSLNTL